MLFRVVILLLAVLAAPAWASDRIVIADFSTWRDAKNVPPDWELKVKSGKADLLVAKDGGFTAVQLRSRNSSFSLQKGVKIDLKRYPLLSWNWKVTQLPTNGDFRKSKTDDQAAQLFLAFTRTKAIVYIWDTSAPQGLTEPTSPVPFMTVHVVVVRSGPAGLGTWINETRNVYEDYKKFFGSEPPEVTGVRLQINSQHTGSSAESFFADIEFRKQ
jgi:hypothetical protein